MPNMLAMLGLGPPELIFILLIIIVIFGARKLPELGRGIGEGLKNFRKGIKDLGESDDDEKNQTDHQGGTSAKN